MAHDGQVNGQAMPKNPFALGYVISISGTYMSGSMDLLQPVMTWLGRRAMRQRLARALQHRYVTNE